MALEPARLSSLADKLYGTGVQKERNKKIKAKRKSKVGKDYKPKKK